VTLVCSLHTRAAVCGLFLPTSDYKG
jgi:hypothetical protein